MRVSFLAPAEAIIDFLIAGLMVLVNLLPEALAEPFQYAFMQRALLTSIVVGAVCGLLSSYVILKRWALLGDAISHAVLPGVAIAYLLGWPFFIGAFATGALTSLGIGVIERNSRIKSDAAMGLMFTAAFALGVVIISQIATSTHLMHILFGNVLGVRYPALMLTLAAGAVTLTVVLLFYKELLIYAFDPVQARSLGLNTRVIHYGLILLLTLTIVASLETVGIILVVSMLITPGATAYLLVNRLPVMMMLATLIGVVSAVLGLFLAFRFNVASGGAIVLVATAFFLLAFLFAPQRGVVARRLRQRASQE
ncbi:metal ABC transporter permease [Wenzhouxiangella limi]|uniref:Metal ABC transporter permease n=1 Tax=Wenzhouxiangella limi TaxID=2707351 RepID=A0A845V4M2_9GAMM|nr:metal ABC transporter permease [Wenzhouxiangella limi]NDY95181.1 metal ABC transporter permease [Wenzhouxiangella limi]